MVVSASTLMLSPSHDGILRNGADFVVPQNTPVLAAADGTVTYVRDDSNAGAQIRHTETMVILTSAPR
ncbi:MAG: M23 family metallopeptidase [Candidatus Nitrosocosmicus sp.]